MSALSAAIFVMSLPNNCLPAFGNGASAREIFEGFMEYRIFDLRNTEIEFAAFPSKQIARSTRFSNSRVTILVCLLVDHGGLSMGPLCL